MNGIFIIGFQKAGTTFLHHLLAQHPEISSNKVKEPHFFCCNHDFINQNFENYLGLFNKKQFFIDSSVSYIHDEAALLQIKD